jgi:hypothetical protein
MTARGLTNCTNECKKKSLRCSAISDVRTKELSAAPAKGAISVSNTTAGFPRSCSVGRSPNEGVEVVLAVRDSELVELALALAESVALAISVCRAVRLGARVDAVDDEALEDEEVLAETKASREERGVDVRDAVKLRLTVERIEAVAGRVARSLGKRIEAIEDSDGRAELLEEAEELRVLRKLDVTVGSLDGEENRVLASDARDVADETDTLRRGLWLMFSDALVVTLKVPPRTVAVGDGMGKTEQEALALFGSVPVLLPIFACVAADESEAVVEGEAPKLIAELLLATGVPEASREPKLVDDARIDAGALAVGLLEVDARAVARALEVGGRLAVKGALIVCETVLERVFPGEAVKENGAVPLALAEMEDVKEGEVVELLESGGVGDAEDEGAPLIEGAALVVLALLAGAHTDALVLAVPEKEARNDEETEDEEVLDNELRGDSVTAGDPLLDSVHQLDAVA